jgi:hypothetical protein
MPGPDRATWKVAHAKGIAWKSNSFVDKSSALRNRCESEGSQRTARTDRATLKVMEARRKLVFCR